MVERKIDKFYGDWTVLLGVVSIVDVKFLCYMYF